MTRFMGLTKDTLFEQLLPFFILSLVAPHLEALKASSPHITDREKAYIRAVMAYAYRNIPGAVDEWMSILICHPRGW